uniref:Uncharacterized protein n=1 Tax=Anguilla anguilla TaxID=7936 RepID=A0A0E9PFY7_ANGAN
MNRVKWRKARRSLIGPVMWGFPREKRLLITQKAQ